MMVADFFISLSNVQAVPTAGAGVSVETGWWVGATGSLADRAAPAVGTSAWFAFIREWVLLIVLLGHPCRLYAAGGL